jgi:phosphatidylglycerol lysyltransferase
MASRRFSGRQLQIVVALVALVIAGVALRGALREFHYREIEAYVATIGHGQFALALALSLLGLLASSSLDLLALRHLGRRTPLGGALLASFVSTSVSNCVSPALLSGGALRFRLFTALGLSAEDVGVLVVFGAGGFWLGFLAAAAAIFLFAAQPLPPSLGLTFPAMRAMGAAFALAVLVYLGACARGPRVLRWGGWELRLPTLRLAIAQTIVSVVDWLLAAAALWVLAPDLRSVPFAAFLAVYLGAQAVGLASHVPAGLGVFEAVVVRCLAPHAAASQVIGALAAYRVAYYLVPLAVSLVGLGIVELRRGWIVFGDVREEAARWLSPWVPSLLAISTFIGGFVLLVSGATPGEHERMRMMMGRVPLSVIEGSHFLASVIGASLLLLAYGLRQRLDAGYVMTTVLLGLGIVCSLLKGLDYEEALLLLAILLALVPARRHFYRRSSILHERYSPRWVVAMGLAVAGSVAIGLFAFKHVSYTPELWSRFSLLGHAPRFLRASIGAAAVVTLGAFAWLLRPVTRPAPMPSARDLEMAQQLISQQPDSRGCLALIGDKTLLFDDTRSAFLMYGVHGRSWVALGDPVGPTEKWDELCWEFRELVDRESGRPAFYDIPTPSLPRYIEMGLTLLKLGDQARVPLTEFSLEGRERKPLRQIVNQAEREGATFSVLAPAQVPAALDELRAVSDHWLARKRTREKGFSMGFFDPDYLMKGAVAVVRSDGRIVAFANLWRGAPAGELSADLMRYTDEAPKNVMDYLFIHLMLWGREQGHSWFDLGMAPLSGLTDHPLAPVWNRVGRLLFRYGEDYYNFQGLRQFKEKYEPVWEPRYLACPGGLGVAGVLLDIASLNSRGLQGVVGR